MEAHGRELPAAPHCVSEPIPDVQTALCPYSLPSILLKVRRGTEGCAGWGGDSASFSSNGHPYPSFHSEVLDAESSHLPSQVRVSCEFGGAHPVLMPQLAGALQDSGARGDIGWAAAACMWSLHTLHHSTGPPLQLVWHHPPGLNLALRVVLCRARRWSR